MFYESLRIVYKIKVNWNVEGALTVGIECRYNFNDWLASARLPSSACVCHATCLATAGVDRGKVWPMSAIARNLGVKRWLWRYRLRQGCHSTFGRLPSNSGGRNTTPRAIRKERVGPRERPAWRGASRTWRCRVLSEEINLMWRLGYSEKMHRLYPTSCRFFSFFSITF